MSRNTRNRPKWPEIFSKWNKNTLDKIPGATTADDLHLLLWSLSEGREEEAAAVAVEEEEVEKGIQKARLLLFLEKKSEVLDGHLFL